MKKRIVVCLSMIVLCLTLLGGCSREPDLSHITSMKELYNGTLFPSFRFASSADYVQFTFDGLMERAHTVALVTPVDELSPDNSHGISDSGDRFYGAYSVREVKALKYYKNDLDFGETFKMAEACVMLSDGSVVAEECVYPMVKDGTYVVFLTNSGYGGYPLVLAADNGKIDLTHLRLNDRPKLIAQAMLDLELTPAKRLNSDIMDRFFLAAYECAEEEREALIPTMRWQTIDYTTSYTARGMEATVAYAVTDEAYYFDAGNVIYRYPLK